MTLYYSILVRVEGDESIASLPADLTQTFTLGAKQVLGVTEVSVEQLIPGSVLLPPTEP